MSKIIINIKGGVQQIIPNAEQVTQTVITKDGKTTVINQITTKKEYGNTDN